MKNYKGIIIGVLLVCMLVGYYIYLSNKSASGKNTAEQTEVEKVLARDLELQYPPSPKEVVKFFSKILKCYYNEEYTDDELVELMEKSRQLFDEELLSENQGNEHFENLKKEINEYDENKQIIFNWTVSPSGDVEYYTQDDDNWALVGATYTIRQKTNYKKSYEQYLLRKDSEGRWKIYGWQLTEKPD